MAKKLRPESNPSISAEALRRVIRQAQDLKAEASEATGRHGKTISGAVEQYGLERNALTFARRLLQTYRRKYGIDTVRGIISRWAPSVENDTGAYVAHVAEQIGVGPDEERRQICAGWAPILVHPDDRFTEGTARQIEAHNEFGREQDCWNRRSS